MRSPHKGILWGPYWGLTGSLGGFQEVLKGLVGSVEGSWGISWRP